MSESPNDVQIISDYLYERYEVKPDQVNIEFIKETPIFFVEINDNGRLLIIGCANENISVNQLQDGRNRNIILSGILREYDAIRGSAYGEAFVEQEITVSIIHSDKSKFFKASGVNRKPLWENSQRPGNPRFSDSMPNAFFAINEDVSDEPIMVVLGNNVTREL